MPKLAAALWLQKFEIFKDLVKFYKPAVQFQFFMHGY
jgi:hypothetical protein